MAERKHAQPVVRATGHASKAEKKRVHVVMGRTSHKPVKA